MDHEEIVETTEELLPPQANVGHVEHSALTVEVSDGLVDIEDLTPTLIAILRKAHSTASYDLLAADLRLQGCGKGTIVAFEMYL